MMWDEQADALLVQLWDETGILADVASGMNQAGYNVTRSAVAGRRYRLAPEQFTRKTSLYIEGGRRLPTKLKVENPPVQKIGQQFGMVRLSKPRKPMIEEKIDLSEHTGIEYLDLANWGCKAVLEQRSGEWGLRRVCGLRRQDNSPYCRGHILKYTNPDTRRQYGQTG